MSTDVSVSRIEGYVREDQQTNTICLDKSQIMGRYTCRAMVESVATDGLESTKTRQNSAAWCIEVVDARRWCSMMVCWNYALLHVDFSEVSRRIN